MPVTLVKSTNVPSVVLGGTITYTIVITNSGPGGATNVVVTDPLTPGINFVAGSVTVDGTSQPSASILSGIPLGTIALGATQTITFQALVTSLPAPVINNTSSAAYVPEGGTETVTVLSNQLSIPAGLATVTVAKSASLPDLTVRDILTYTSVITTNGVDMLTNVSFTDLVPPGTSFVLGSVTVDGVVAPDANPGTGIPLSNIAAGASVSISFFVSIDSLPPSRNVTNTSSVSYMSGGISGTNLSAPVVRRVFVPIYTLVKTVNKTVTFVGDIITYSVVVTNNGNITANLSVVDPVQTGATFIPNTVTVNGTPVPGARPGLGISLGNFPIGVSAVIQYQVRVNTIPTPPFVMNTVTATYDTLLPSGRAISGSVPPSSASVFVVDPRISLQLEASAAAATGGETLVYTVTATNIGNANAQLTVTSSIPSGAQFVVNSVTVQGTAQPGINPEQGVDLGTISPGQSVSFSYQVIVSIPLSVPDLFNTATGAGLFEGIVPANVAPASLIVPIQLAQASLSTVASFVVPGDRVDFSLVIVNQSTVLDLDSVVSFVPLPPGLEFIPGSVTVNGITVPVINLEAGIPVGILASGAQIGVSFSVQVTGVEASEQPISASVQYSVNQQGLFTVQSNTLELIVVDILPQVTKQVDAAQISPGDIVSYVVQALVPSGEPLNAVLVDNVPAGLQYVPNSLLINGTPSEAQDLSGGVPLGLVSTLEPVTVFFRALVLNIPPQSISQPLQASNSALVSFSTGNNRVDILSPPALSVITTAAFRIIATPSPPLSEAGEIVTISISITAIGSQAAEGSLSGFTPAGFLLLNETITVNGQPAALVNQNIPLGVLNPGDVIQIQFNCFIPFDFIAATTTGSAILSFDYDLEGRIYHGMAAAPSYQIVVEEILE
ncbi:DUF7507 domain-containing protein [Paenibacillus herberti]|uniref:DUF11 domain-containing protein n=1 Tax=Paenibacillus herberti TaxID=1619309 RepID=A0A229NVN4_9BACL|nr:DUF11 domain-containing protein [Paenibacillus herberti]OXM13977.1 hypothetical protein CGZ75_13300 [Paenibacillus herberti]